MKLQAFRASNDTLTYRVQIVGLHHLSIPQYLHHLVEHTELPMSKKTRVARLPAVVLYLALLFVALPSTNSFGQSSAQTTSDYVEVLFLGGNGHHEPAERLRQVLPKMSKRGLNITYTDRVDALNSDNLKRFDVLMMYANHMKIGRAQERALLQFVQKGGGFVPIHAASACFQNSEAFIRLVGGAFKSHETGTFKTDIVRSEHPAIQGVPNFTSWDETYIHSKHNSDKTVLSYRVEDGHREPWTWVRRHGNGRVFYTAWGHDARTWSKKGFHDLIEQGTRWAAGDWALKMKRPEESFEYVEGSVPYYPPEEDWGVTGEPITDLQKPLSPKESMQHMRVPPGFKVELFASDPQIVNPIDMTWDASGRLWIAETIDYPNEFQPKRQGNDRIKILEDTNSDGKADKSTIFAEGLNIITSLALVNGGVVVSQAPDILFLKDTDGDDKADVEKVLFTGWGTFDTHAGPGNLRYGFDNQIWGTVGYSGFEGQVGQDSLAFAQGLYRFTPNGSSMEVMANTNNNTWGLGFNEEGLVFASTANDNPSVHMAIPNRFFNQVQGWGAPTLQMIADSPNFYPVTERVRQVDQHGKYTSGAGHSLYTARRFPEKFWNRMAFVAGPTGHLLGRFALESKGSGFVAHNEWSMLASRDEWTAPVQSKVGPDGALWIVDWYNLIIQHNPTPEGYETGEGNAYENELRDRQHSRIYRLMPKDGHEGYDPMNLKGASSDELVQALKHDNMFWRLTAQRLLVERGKSDVLPKLYKVVKDESIDELGLNQGAIHALWIMHGLDALEGSNAKALEVALDALHHPSTGVRRTALQVLPRTKKVLDELTTAGMLEDANPRVRLAALLAVSEMPVSDQVGKAAYQMLLTEENATDKWIPAAITAAGAQHVEGFLTAALAPVKNAKENKRPEAVSKVVQQVAHHYAAAGAKDFVPMLAHAEKANAANLAAVLSGFNEGWPEGNTRTLSNADRERLNTLQSNLEGPQAERMQQLMDRWSK